MVTVSTLYKDISIKESKSRFIFEKYLLIVFCPVRRKYFLNSRYIHMASVCRETILECFCVHFRNSKLLVNTAFNDNRIA